MSYSFQNALFVEENFRKADLKDARLTKRLCILTEKMTNKPNFSIPTQMENWQETKACYRFFNNPKVTHKRIQFPHRKRVKKLASEEKEDVFFIQDLSEIDYSTRKATKGLGQAGNQFGKGIQMHSCLAVKGNLDLIGLAHQVVWERKASRGKAKIGEQFRGKKESEVWIQTLKAIGSPPRNCRWITICDRGSDCFEFFYEAKRLGWHAVIRACQNRCIKVNNKEKKLMEWMRILKPQGTRLINVRKKGETTSRDILLNVAWEEEVLLCPSGSNKEMSVSVIRYWNDEEEIEWILYSTIKVTNVEEAIEKANWYAKRWIIEEYHKCIKTGCRVESRQLETSKALEALVGVLGVIATMMLYLRHLARDSSEELAENYIPQIPLKIICTRFKLNIETLTIYEFWRTVARMGGFLNRKSDGEPGWQTLWLGWLQLLNMVQGVEAFTNT